MREFYPGIVDPIQDPELNPMVQGWAHTDENKRRHLEALNRLMASNFPSPNVIADQGMVIVGGGKFAEGIIIAARMLRECGSTMPIQIWHRGSLEPIPENAFRGIDGVTVIDSIKHAESVGGARIMRGWEQKLHAIAHCGFRKVLYIDADAYPVDNPAPLMNLLNSNQFVFWTDLPGNFNTVKWPQVWPAGDAGVPAIQGGQLAIHRESAWRTIILAHWMNQHSDFYYSHMFGDQDTWRVAIAAQNDRRTWHSIGPAPWVKTAFVCPIDSKPIIVHRCQGKLFRPENIPVGKQGYSSPKWELPKEGRVYKLFCDLLGDIDDSQKVFGEIYDRKLWGNQSGPGSDVSAEAKPYVDLMSILISIGGFKSVVDLGCGDGRVGKALKVQSYFGADVHIPFIQQLQAENIAGYQWKHMDFFKDRESLPSADICLMKDVLHHWPTKMVVEWISWAMNCKKWRRIFLTQDVHQTEHDTDTYLGGYRALNPLLRPLNQFPLKTVAPYLHKAVLLLEPTQH